MVDSSQKSHPENTPEEAEDYWLLDLFRRSLLLSRGDVSSMFQNKLEPNRDTDGNTKLETMQIIFKHLLSKGGHKVLNSAFQLTMVVPNDPNINIGMNRRYIEHEISKYTGRHNKIKTNN